MSTFLSWPQIVMLSLCGTSHQPLLFELNLSHCEVRLHGEKGRKLLGQGRKIGQEGSLLCRFLLLPVSPLTSVLAAYRVCISLAYILF